MGVSVQTRFPPEPNGYLHIGHAKAIVLNFEIAKEFGGACNLRFDDTNPEKESVEFVESITRDIRCLGYEVPASRIFYASNYFDKLYEYARVLVQKNCAYVDSCTQDEIRAMRGTPTEPGVESPHRGRSVEENLRMLEAMKNGEYREGECVLRAKIDMKHPNIVMRDPAVYRIRYAEHHNTKDRWCIYPMYDFAHCLSDAIEGITHSLCTLEFEIHRPLYDWFLEACDVPTPRPQQTEFARLNLTHTVLSKRVLKKLVESGIVEGWDDPRMPTLSGIRRRGYPAAAVRAFCESIGVTKASATVEIERLEESVREELNKTALRAMVVLDPVPLVITNYPEDKEEHFDAENNPEQEHTSTHRVVFSRTVFVERSDVMEDPPAGYFRLAPGKEVRLKYAYYVTCTEVVKNPDGSIREVRATYDEKSRGGWSNDGRKVKGTIHWVSSRDAVDICVMRYGRLFEHPHPEQQCADSDALLQAANPNSKALVAGVKAEPFVLQSIRGHEPLHAESPLCMQFLRLGYFTYDEKNSAGGTVPVFLATVDLKDTKKHKL